MNNKKMLDFQTIAVDFDGTLLQQMAGAWSAKPGTDRISPGMETQWQQTHSLGLPRR